MRFAIISNKGVDFMENDMTLKAVVAILIIAAIVALILMR